MFEETFGLKIMPTRLEGAAASAYAPAVRGVLLKIHAAAAGKVLLRSINYWGFTVRIVPYLGDDPCGADVIPEYNPDTGFISPRVRYSPDKYHRSGSCPQLAGTEWPEVILFHELVHAFRMISQSLRRNYTHAQMTGGLYRYTDLEEFVAVLSENVLRSERGNPLRADHHTTNVLSPQLSDSFGFFASSAQTFRFVERFCKENPGFTKALSQVRSRFNPLAAYYKDRQKALEQSYRAASIQRDAAGFEQDFFEKMARGRSPVLPP